jgi:UbiD family decarboxylase
MSAHTEFTDLREYLAVVDDAGDLRRIEGADWDLEIGALTESVAFSETPNTLLFDDIEGYPTGYRVVTNLYNTETRQALALGLPPDASGVDLVSHWREKSETIEPRAPTTVDDGPIRENVATGDDVDILEFPVPFWGEADGGRYFGTGDVTFTRGLDGEWINSAPYRAQVHDEQTLGLLVVPIHHGSIQMREYWERGEDAPVVMTAGQSPAVFGAACIPFPRGRTELEFAGGLNGSPIEVIRHEETGLPVPANAEIAVIGRVPPPETETRTEGPYGECMGYYAGGEELPVIHIDEIWHRDDPILQGNPTMYGSAMRHALGGELITSARIWDSIEDDVPNVEGVYTTYQPCQQGASVISISIEQEYAGHAKQAAAAALGSQAGSNMNRMVIVVDEDIDPANWEEVMFALASRFDAGRDMDLVEGIPSSGLDVRISPERMEAGDHTTTAMLIDATKPYHWNDEFPRRNVISDDLHERTVTDWHLEEWDDLPMTLRKSELTGD